MNNTINAETGVYNKIQNELDVKGQNLTEYIYLNGLTDNKKGKLLVGLQNSIINFGVNSPFHT